MKIDKDLQEKITPLFFNRRFEDIITLLENRRDLGEQLLNIYCQIRTKKPDEVIFTCLEAFQDHGLKLVGKEAKRIDLFRRLIKLDTIVVYYYWKNHTNLALLNNLKLEVINFKRGLSNPFELLKSALIGTPLTMDFFKKIYGKGEHLNVILNGMYMLNEEVGSNIYIDRKIIYQYMAGAYANIDINRLKQNFPLKSDSPSEALQQVYHDLVTEVNRFINAVMNNEAYYDSEISKSFGFKLHRKSYSVSDSHEQQYIENIGNQHTNHIALIPKEHIGKRHQNIIVWFDDKGIVSVKTNVRNDPFDFIYYLAWLRQNGQKDGLYYGKEMSEEDKNSIIPGYEKYLSPKRFIADWTTSKGGNYRSKKMSLINGYLNVELIEWNGSHFKFSDKIEVELKPYPKY